MTRSLFSILLLCLALLSLAQAATIQVRTELDTEPAESELSNGERMARGMRPNKPRKLYEPTAVRPRDSTQSPSVVDPNTQLQNVAVGSPSTPGGRKRGLLSYLRVLNSGILSTTTDQTAASFFIVPTTNGVMQWVPQATGGGFVTGLGYPMYASGDAIGGAASLLFSPTLPANAITNLFGTAPFSGGFAPRIGSQALQFMMSGAGQMYMAASLALAQAVIQDLQIMAVQSFIQGQVASIAQAQQVIRAATAVALPNPVRVWAQSSDGSVQGWLSCLSGGNGCLQIAVGNQGDPGTTFYLPGLGSSQSNPQPMLAQADYITTTVITNQLDSQTGLLYSGQGMDTAVSRVPNELGFSVPPSGKGQIYPLQSYPGSFAVKSGSRLLYACGSGGCSGITPAVKMCVETVPLSGSPSACAAAAAAAADQAKRVNPTQLYVTQVSAPNGGYPLISGWVNTDTGSLVVKPSQSSATTFYYPNLGSFVPAYSDSNGVLKISQATIVSNAGYAAGIGRPMMVPQSNNYAYQSLNWMGLSSTNGGIIKPTVYWNSGGYGYNLFYQRTQNSLVLAYDLAGALNYDSTMVQVCVESVTPGQQPTGACKPYVPTVQTRTFPMCPTQINTGSVSYARMTLYDSEANALGAPFVTNSESDCLAYCNDVNKSRPGTCTGAWYVPLGISSGETTPCHPRGQGNRWQKDWIAGQKGVSQFLVGKCSDYVNGASGVPDDMLNTCCDNPAAAVA